jgi:serine/threonine-protein kinase
MSQDADHGPPVVSSERCIGKYQLIAELGHGGMADVYLAVTQATAGFTFNKLLAVKILRPHLTEDPQYVSLFHAEARLAALLNHKNVVQTIDAGQDGPRFFLAMEYLEGQPLSRILTRAGQPLPLAIHIRILAYVLAGLHYAHELLDVHGNPLNVVHRDVSPQNVFIGYDGIVKVMDFGVAKAQGDSVDTKAGVLKGKLRYMSPEQLRSGEVDRRADIFVVGLMLWEAATGRRAWQDLSELEIVNVLLNGQVRPPLAVARKVDPVLNEICVRSLAPDPADRYASAGEMQADLERLLQRWEANINTRDVGQFVCTHFEADRQRIRRLVEARLESGSDGIDGQPLPQLGPAAISPSSIYPSSNFSASDLAGRTPSVSSTFQVQTVSGAPTATPRSKLALWSFGGLVAAGLLGVWFMAQTPSGSSGRDGPASSPSIADRSSNLSIDSARRSARISIKADPPEAEILLDDRRLIGNPFVGEFVEDDARHVMTIRAAGYESRSETLTFRGDQNIILSLVPVTVPASGQSPDASTPSVLPVHVPKPAGPRPIDVRDPWSN